MSKCKYCGRETQAPKSSPDDLCVYCQNVMQYLKCWPGVLDKIVSDTYFGGSHAKITDK
jgi:hypothetical protein